MKSIRTRFTILTIFAIMISLLATVLIVSLSVSKYISMKSDDLLRVVCSARKEAINNYFSSIEQSVDTVANYAEDDIENNDDDIAEHLRRTDQLFETIAKNTKGTLTYYYRVDPDIAGDKVGFWYQKGEGNEFISSELTEIEKYDPDNISRVGWYYIPKQTGGPVWMDPYDNDNMGVRMISYVVPVFRNGDFFGVIGIDFSYEDLVAHVGEVDEFDTGRAFLTDKNGNIINHTDIEAGTSLESISPDLADGAGTEDGGIVRYSYQGQKQRAVYADLGNNMRLYVTVSDSEILSGLRQMISRLILTALAIMAVFILFTSMAVRRITHPLSELTNAASALDRGDYEVDIDYNGDDEIGILTHTFRQMRDHLKSHIGSLNDMAFKDSLTSIRNKSAFDSYAERIDERIRSVEDNDRPEFAVCMFDCNDLKEINDKFGHDKGDLYLKASCRMICEIFRHSAVFRIGGDEFIAVLQNTDYENREEVCRIFEKAVAQSLDPGNDPWDRISVAKGLAVFDPSEDTCTADVVKRADGLMYADKLRMKGTN